ncbi:MAG: cohesin domain-containing protein [Dehalococcoidia bacterium]|jgi:hypothetical protein
MNTIRVIALGLTVLVALLVGANVPAGQDSALAAGERGTLYIDVLPDANNTATGYGTIDVCRDTDNLGGALDVGDTFTIDVIIDGANDLAGPVWWLYYNRDVLNVTAYDWSNWKMGPGGLDLTDIVPDSDGQFACTYGQATGVDGDGVLLRVTLQAVANGSSDLKLCAVTGECPHAWDSSGVDHYYPEVLVHDPPGNVRVVVGGACGAVGGVAELPGASDSSRPNRLALAGIAALVALALAGGVWYARKRRGRQGNRLLRP